MAIDPASAFVLLLIFMLPIFLSLRSLRNRNMHDVAKAIWAFIVVVLPVIGPFAYFIVRPGEHLSE